MYRTDKKQCEQTMTNMLIKTGVQEEIATSILGPKVTRTINVPEVTPTKEDANVNGGKVYKRHVPLSRQTLQTSSQEPIKSGTVTRLVLIPMATGTV